MAGVVDVLGLLVILLVNASVTALMTRFFRVRLKTRWGSMIYALVICPVVLGVLVIVMSGVFGLGVGLGSRATAVTLTILLPLAVGITFDYFWMPAPDDVELPDTMQQ